MRPPHACRWLMTKGWFFWPLAPGAQPAPGPDGEPPTDPEAKTTGFWCNRTQQPFGPDGDRACEETCRRGRSCFEPEVEA